MVCVLCMCDKGGGFGGKKESGQLRFGGRERPFRKPMFVALSFNGSCSSVHCVCVCVCVLNVYFSES